MHLYRIVGDGSRYHFVIHSEFGDNRPLQWLKATGLPPRVVRDGVYRRWRREDVLERLPNGIRSFPAVNMEATHLQ